MNDLIQTIKILDSNEVEDLLDLKSYEEISG